MLAGYLEEIGYTEAMMNEEYAAIGYTEEDEDALRRLSTDPHPVP